MESGKRAALVLVLCLSAGGAWATSGGVDSSGCHDSKKIGFHCHPERAGAGAGASSRHASGEKVKDRERRMKRECKGRPNAGACAGYGG